MRGSETGALWSVVEQKPNGIDHTWIIARTKSGYVVFNQVTADEIREHRNEGSK